MTENYAFFSVLGMALYRSIYKNCTICFFFSLFVEEQICCMKTPQHSRAYKNINLNKKLPKDSTKYKLLI